MALPGFGSWQRCSPSSRRKPLFAYRVAAAGMIGVALLSFFVWQHHLSKVASTRTCDPCSC